MINIVYYRPRKKYYVYSNPYLKYIDIIMGCKNMYDMISLITIKIKYIGYKTVVLYNMVCFVVGLEV